MNTIIPNSWRDNRIMVLDQPVIYVPATLRPDFDRDWNHSFKPLYVR